HYQRGPCAMATGGEAGAIRDFDQSLAIIEHRRQEIAADALRDSFSGFHEHVFESYLELLAARRAYDRLFAVAEEARARLILDRLSPTAGAEPLPAATVVHEVGRDTAIVEYVTLPQSLVILILDSRGLRAREVAAPVEAI